jgi:hypothetical protein
LRHDDTDRENTGDPPVKDERASEGVEHLQAAAHEMIEAARAFLDVIEDFVGDDEKMASVADAVSSVARGASRAARPSSGPDDGDSGGGSVQHIKVS